ncbi:MAG: hypothetical protein IJ741_02940 [Schwartzia sp.]|nr:hypothetical protein [Schwartzia sp. (in: firmicutes)]
MKKELPHFNVEEAYGGSQRWCVDHWMWLGGCAAVTACDSSLYFTLHKGIGGLYPYDAQAISKADYVRFADVMRPYLRPRRKGVNRLPIYIEGFRRFLRERGARNLLMTPWPGRRSFRETREIVKAQIENGWPVPCLTLRHRRAALRLYVWHWFLLNGYEETAASFKVKAVTFGEWRWVDFRELWDTGYAQRGGLILYDTL